MKPLHSEKAAEPQPQTISGIESNNAVPQTPATTPDHLTPLTGRDIELALLQDRWDRTQEGMGQAVLLSGEAGLGKSRLVHSIKKLIEEETEVRRVIEWRCEPAAQDSSLYPVVEFFERTLGCGTSEEPNVRFDRLARHLDELGIDQPEIVALFAKLLFIPMDERFAESGYTPNKEREETFRALHRWLRALAERAPVLLTVEDLHWLDASSLELLTKFISEGAQDQILILLTYRPEFTPQWPALSHQTTLALTSLTKRQTAELVRRSAGNALPDTLIRQIYQRTAGIPLLVEEYCQLVGETHLIDLTKGEQIPETLQQLLCARLDQMSIIPKVVQLASTIGREFPYDLLASVADMDEAVLKQELAKLVTSRIIHVKPDQQRESYIFKHALLEESVYNEINPQTKQDYHHRIAIALESDSPNIAESRPEVLAWHFEMGGIPEKAAEYWIGAGFRSRKQFANTEAISHLTKARSMLELVPASDERDKLEVQMLGMLGTSLIAAQGYAAPEVGPVFDRARYLCEKAGDPMQAFGMLWGKFAYHIVRADFRLCDELSEEAILFARKLADPVVLLEAYFLRGLTHLYRGNFASAKEACETAIASYDSTHDRTILTEMIGEDPAITTRCYLSLALWHLGLADQSKECCREMTSMARSLAHPFSLEYSLHHSAWLYQHCRLGDECLKAANEQVRLAQEQGFPFWKATGMLYQAGAHFLHGKLERGFELFRTGLQEYRATGAGLGLPYYLSVLAEGLLQSGQYSEAKAALEEAFSLLEANDERFQEAELHRLRGEVLLAETGNEVDAEKQFRHSIEIARKQGSRAWELRSTISLAKLLQKQGRSEKAHSELLPIYDSLKSEVHHLPDVRDAAWLLESLGNERMKADFASGVAYVRGCIPQPISGNIAVDWRYIPSSKLGGDMIGYHWLDEDCLALYLIDVTGHGLDAALLSVTISNVIRSGSLPGADPKRPGQVLTSLNTTFKGSEHADLYFTIWYCTYQRTTGELSWAGGGHPGSILLPPNNSTPPLVLASTGPLLGAIPGMKFGEESIQLEPGSRLLIVSDGVYEILRDGRMAWPHDAFINYVTKNRDCPNLMDELLHEAHRLGGTTHLADDFSVIEAIFGRDASLI